MASNRGKQFEEVIKRSFEAVPDAFVVRLPDPTNGYLGVRNISDFMVFKYPYLHVIECKSVHGNTLPLSNITRNQWDGMLASSHIRGIYAGVICWWVDKDVTKYIPIHTLDMIRMAGDKSVHFMKEYEGEYILEGKKKRVFFDYDMERFFLHFFMPNYTVYYSS